jgi:hypothetical protein
MQFQLNHNCQQTQVINQLTPMGALAPGSAHARPSAHVYVSGGEGQTMLSDQFSRNFRQF